MAKGLRHIGTQGRTPLLVLGYNGGRNEVAVIDLKLLRPEEQTWLAEFISQERVYNARTLSEPMNNATYGGSNAFAYFLSRAQQLPFYEVNVSVKEQCLEWTKTDSRVDTRLPEHPFITRIHEMIAARATGAAPPTAPIPEAAPVEARSGAGDVMDTVREFMKTSGQAAAFVARPDGESSTVGTKSENDISARVSALENSLARIEKLLAPTKKPGIKRAGKK